MTLDSDGSQVYFGFWPHSLLQDLDLKDGHWWLLIAFVT